VIKIVMFRYVRVTAESDVRKGEIERVDIIGHI
jgi:hypothetical protein